MNRLNDIPGQDLAKKILLNSYNRSRIASTYLFYGPDGVGKWSMAMAVAALLNCEDRVKDDDGRVIDACGKCRNCRAIANLIFQEMYFAVPLPPRKSDKEIPDRIREYLDIKKEEPYKIVTSTRQLTIPIECAREIKRQTSVKPTENMTRVVVFYQMEKMLASSADSLLKLIEEPPPETVIILTAIDPNNLLPTIQSRSQKIRFKPVATDDIASYLSTKYEIPEGRAGFAARLSLGSLGQALDLVSDESDSSLRQVSLLMLKEILTGNTPSAVNTAVEFLNPNDRGSAERVLSYWQSYFSDLICVRYGKGSDRIINADFKTELEQLAGKIGGPDSLAEVVDQIGQLQGALRLNVHIRPAMAAFVLKARRAMAQSA